MHYLAPGKKNLVWHLTSKVTHGGRILLHTRKDLDRWNLEELEGVHKEFHEFPDPQGVPE